MKPSRSRALPILVGAVAATVVSAAVFPRSEPPAPPTPVPTPPKHEPDKEPPTSSGEDLTRGFKSGKRFVLRGMDGTYDWKHGETVYGVAVLPDGTRGASVGKDGLLRVWDLAKGRELRTIVAHAAPANAIALRPGFPDQVITGGNDHAARVWDLATGKLVATLTDSANLLSVAVSSDGKHALTGSTSGHVGYWDIETGRELRRMSASRRNAYSVAFVDGKRAAAASDDIKIWDLETGKLIRTLSGHEKAVWCIVARGGRIYSASHDMTAGVWDVESGERIATLRGHTNWAYSVATAGNVIATGAKDRTLSFWDASTFDRLRSIEKHQNAALLSLAFTPKGDRILSGSIDRSLGFFDVLTGADLRDFSGHSAVAALALAGDRVLSVGWEGTLRVRNVARGAKATAHSIGTTWGQTVSVSSDGKRALTMGSGGVTRTFELGDEVRELESFSRGGDIIASTISPDGQRGLSVGRDRRVLVWDLETRADGRALDLRGIPHEAVFSPSGTQLLVGGADKSVRLVGVASGDESWVLHGHPANASVLAFSRDEKLGVTGDDQGMLFLWDLAKGELVRSWSAHKVNVRALAFSPDGRFIASGGNDGFVYVWDTATQRLQIEIDLLTATDVPTAIAWGKLLHVGTTRGVVLDFSVE